MAISSRGIQRALGALWLVDGLLQLQPFMFGPGLPNDVIAPAADGQPAWVSGAVHLSASLIGTHPAVFNTAFAAVQIAIGVGLLVSRTVRLALAASIVWSLGVWLFGEGLGGLTSGHADLITGAPGAVALYGVLAVAVWPRRSWQGRPASWLARVWAVLWVGGAVLETLPMQNRASDLAATLDDNADGAPEWLAALDRGVAHLVAQAGDTVMVALALTMAVVGLLALRRGTMPVVAAVAGSVLAVTFWVVGQNIGELYTGQSTDPNTAPLIVLIALGMVGPTVRRGRSDSRPVALPTIQQKSISEPAVYA